MDLTIWVDGEETLRTRSVAAARSAYRKELLAYFKDRESPTARVRERLAEFDTGRITLGCFSVGVGSDPSGDMFAVAAMFHR